MHFPPSMNVMWIYKYILFLLMGATSLQANAASGYAGPQPKRAPVERFTPDEKKFLAAIGTKAKQVVSKNLTTTQYQLNCIKNKCSQSDQILAAVKSAYLQYRTYYVMTDYTYFNAFAKEAYGSSEDWDIPLSNDYSPYEVIVNPTERKRLVQIHDEDVSFLKTQKEKCGLTKDSLINHYRRQLSQIITLVPVVLLIEARENVPSDSEIIAGYEELIQGMQETYNRFANYDQKNLEGLWVYQMLVETIVTEQPKLKPIAESLRIKIEPQGFWEHLGDWVSNTFFSYNILFIGCTVVAIVTVNPIIAMGCALANTLMSAYNLYNDTAAISDAREEWLSGVTTFENVQSAKLQAKLDVVLLGLNMAAGAFVVKSVRGMPLFNPAFHKEILASNLKNEVIRQKANAYVKDLLKDQSQDQAKSLGNSLAVSAFQYFVRYEDLEKISQASADILISYRNKGVYTFKDTAKVVCTATTQASKE